MASISYKEAADILTPIAWPVTAVTLMSAFRPPLTQLLQSPSIVNSCFVME
jgi:hypothetical protein